MRAIVIDRFGGAEVLRMADVPVPVPGPRQILVRNRASSVNPIDIRKRGGYGRAVFSLVRGTRFPWLMGNDVAGTVERVGARVRRWRIGEAVFAAPGLARQHAWAEYVVLDEAEAVCKPRALAFEEAAALPYVGLTAWAAFAAVGVGPDAPPGRALVLGASGGVGTVAVQLLRHWGWSVATTSSAKNHALLRDLGAAQTLDYTRDDIAALAPVDLVLDAVGDAEERAIARVRDDGGYVTIVHPVLATLDAHGLVRGGLRLLAAGLAHRRRHRRIRYARGFFRADAGALERIRGYVDAGALRPVVERTFPLAQIADAHTHVETGRARGKVVLAI